MELDPLPLYKTQVQMVQNLNIRPETLKMIEETLGKHFKT